MTKEEILNIINKMSDGSYFDIEITVSTEEEGTAYQAITLRREFCLKWHDVIKNPNYVR